MDLNIRWHQPIRLKNRSSVGGLYEIEDLDALPREPGIYVFARRKGAVMVPVYIGQASRIRGRIKQQLNNARLMLALLNSPGRQRFLCYATFESRPGQTVARSLSVAERSLIDSALADGHDIVNVQGTKKRHHTITSSGNRDSRSWIQNPIYTERRK